MGEKPNSRFVSAKYSNVQSNLIEITEDKLELIVTKYSDQLKKSRDWVGYSGISITILISLLTCEFNKNFIGISKDIWYTLFVICFVVSFILLIKSLYNMCRFRNIARKMIEEIKNEKDK